MYVVISIAHLPDHDRMFIHGIFQEKRKAEQVANEVENDQTYIREEGYLVPQNTQVSVYISDIPMGVRVNDFVPTIL